MIVKITLMMTPSQSQKEINLFRSCFVELFIVLLLEIIQKLDLLH